MKKSIELAFNETLKSLNYPKINVLIQLPKNPKHGDFTSNVALQLGNKLKASPTDIAKKIISFLIPHNSDLISSAEIAGPGFINIRINKSSISKLLYDVLDRNKNFGKNNAGNEKKAQVEFVSANPTGPLTVAHGRGAILGDVISNILEWNGYKVEREYYYNNAGRQMNRLGESVRSRYLQLLGQKISFPEDGYEGEYIIKIAQKLIDDSGDIFKNNKDIEKFKNAAESSIFAQIKNTLDRIGLKFDNFFNENTLYDSGAINTVIDKLKEKNLVYKKENATWFKASTLGREQDRVIIKSSGEPTYRLPDIAYHKNKFDRKYDLLIDVLGADHMDAYPDVLAAISQLECDIKKIKVVIHQFVTLTDKGSAIKMSTRKAQYITLDELIDEVGKDVVRYFFIMRGTNSHLNFDMALAKDESDENPVFYLQYAHARLSNILKHAESSGISIDLDTNLEILNEESEIQLINFLLEFPNIISQAKKNLEPQTIATYLQKLAGMFHKYYAKERIVTEDLEKTLARLILIKSLKIVLFNGLTILGIHAPNKM